MENTIMNETLEGLLNTINYTTDAPQALIDMGTIEARYLKDLKINMGNALKYESLSEKESALLALSVAINEKTKTLENALIEKARLADASQEEILETYACVSLLNVNNVFYRFRHFVSSPLLVQLRSRLFYYFEKKAIVIILPPSFRLLFFP